MFKEPKIDIGMRVKTTHASPWYGIGERGEVIDVTLDEPGYNHLMPYLVRFDNNFYIWCYRGHLVPEENGDSK